MNYKSGETSLEREAREGIVHGPAQVVLPAHSPYLRHHILVSFSTLESDALSCAMTSMTSFSLNIFSTMTTTSPPPGSTTYGIVNRTGPHGLSIVRWSGHDCVSITHSWPDDVTTRTCPTNARVNVAYVISGWLQGLYQLLRHCCNTKK